MEAAGWICPRSGQHWGAGLSAGGEATASLSESVRGHFNPDVGATQQLELSGNETRLPLRKALPQEPGAMDARQAMVIDRTLKQDKQVNQARVTAGTAGTGPTAAGGAVET